MGTVRKYYETLVGEQMKTSAENTLHLLGQHEVGRKALELYAFGSEGRIVDPRLNTSIVGTELEHPVMVGAGWDKTGRALVGLHALGFSAAEPGSILLFGQYGNKKPRLFTINREHSVGINRFGFNSPGAEKVSENLEEHDEIPFPIGANIGLNKLMPAEKAPWAYAAVVPHIGRFASYIALGVSSPNTAHVRGLQRKGPLNEITLAVQEEIDRQNLDLQVVYKVDGDQTDEQLYEVLEVALERGIGGIAAINTTTRPAIKARYGSRWEEEAGGLSGDDEVYRKLATDRVRFIYEEAGDKLDIFGVGGIKDAETALEKIRAGASAVQLVTAIRPSWGRVAADTVKGMVSIMDRDGTESVREYVGVDTNRGAKAI